MTTIATAVHIEQNVAEQEVIMMMNDKHEFKVGDTVFVYGRFKSITIATVDKITAAGNIKVGNILFKPNGFERTSDTYNFSWIMPATPEQIKRYHENSYISKVKKFAIAALNEDTITIDQAEKLCEILKLDVQKPQIEE
jgi:DNA-binding Xre family transcriptional regulator